MNYLRINRKILSDVFKDSHTIRTVEELLEIVNSSHVDDANNALVADFAFDANHATDAELAFKISLDVPPLPAGADNGSIVYDEEYIYVKGRLGWRKSYLDNFSNITRIPFRYMATLTSAAAGTAVTILPAFQYYKAFITQMILKVDGATSWTDASSTIVKIQDPNSLGAPIIGITVPKAMLLGNAVIFMSTAGLTLGTPVTKNVGFGPGEGIEIVADGNFASGSNIVVTLIGDYETYY